VWKYICVSTCKHLVVTVFRARSSAEFPRFGRLFCSYFSCHQLLLCGLRVGVCVCVCSCACIYIWYAYINIYIVHSILVPSTAATRPACLCVCVFVRAYVCIFDMHIYIYMCFAAIVRSINSLRVDGCVCVCVYIFMYTYICVSKHIYVYIDT